MSLFKYALDPSSKKYKCPSCGQRRFVVYIDNETKQVVDEYTFGRCDRENECGYHEHPQSDPNNAHKIRDFVPGPVPEYRQIFPPVEIVTRITERTKTCVSPLHRFLNRALIPNDHLVKWGVYSDDDKTVFVYRNASGQVVNLKYFKYKEDGHRDKNFNSYSLKNPPEIPALPGQQQIIEKHMMCLFGEHLLDPRKEKIVCLVESEKSAPIAAYYYPQFDWLAVGSNNGLTDGTGGKPDKITPLKGRKVYWVGDADKASRMQWEAVGDSFEVRPSSIAKLLAHNIDFEVVDLYPERNDGYDIADANLDGLRPEIKPTSKPPYPAELEKPKLDGEVEDEVDFDLPKGVKWNDVKADIRKYMHFDHNGKIYIARKRRGNEENRGTGSFYTTPISNFTIRSLGLIHSEVDPTRLVEIKNIHGHVEVVKVPTKAFASPNEFTVFVESVGNFQYDGEGKDLKKIRSKLYDTMHRFDEVDSLGWHWGGNYLFANGAHDGLKFRPIDKYGFVKLGERNFFLQPLSCITSEANDEWEDEKKFMYKERDVKMKDWAKLFCDVHRDNGRIALAWYITSLFRDFVYQRFKFFPHLFLFGPPGTGKSQVGWSIRSMGFTGLVKPFNLNTGTAVAFHRELSHFKNFPAWFDEYDNSIAFERIQSLKAAYDGVGHKKSVKDSDKRTKSTQVNRGAMISGQQLPIADNALFKRVILCQFHQTEYTAEQKKLFAELQDMEEGGLTHITAGFMRFRKLIEEKFYLTFDLVLSDLMEGIKKAGFDVEDRIARNAALILTTIKLLADQIPDELPYSYDQLKAVLVKNIKEQMSLISSSNETNAFWDTVVFLAQKGEIKYGEDFNSKVVKTVKLTINRKDEVLELDHSKELLFIRFSKIIPLYREAFKRQNSSNSSPMDKGSLIHYLQNSKAFIGLVSNHDFNSTRTSCYCFDYELLKAMNIDLGGAGDIGSAGNSSLGSDEATEAGADSDDMPF